MSISLHGSGKGHVLSLLPTSGRMLQPTAALGPAPPAYLGPFGVIFLKVCEQLAPA